MSSADDPFARMCYRKKAMDESRARQVKLSRSRSRNPNAGSRIVVQKVGMDIARDEPMWEFS